jgi:phospholipase A-2-activating protein
VKLWKLNGSLSLELVGEHAEHGAFVNSVALSSSGEGTLHVASGGTDGIIYLYDFMKNELIRTLIGHSGNVCCLIFTPRGKLLSCSWDKTAKLWENASIIFSLEGHEQAVWGACVVNDSVFLTGIGQRFYN